MNTPDELREKIAEAIWNAGDTGTPKWSALDPKIDKMLKKDIYGMADAVLEVIKLESVL